MLSSRHCLPLDWGGNSSKCPDEKWQSHELEFYSDLREASHRRAHLRQDNGMKTAFNSEWDTAMGSTVALRGNILQQPFCFSQRMHLTNKWPLSLPLTFCFSDITVSYHPFPGHHEAPEPPEGGVSEEDQSKRWGGGAPSCAPEEEAGHGGTSGSLSFHQHTGYAQYCLINPLGVSNEVCMYGLVLFFTMGRDSILTKEPHQSVFRIWYEWCQSVHLKDVRSVVDIHCYRQ